MSGVDGVDGVDGEGGVDGVGGSDGGFDHDVVVVGSGFGGSVAALRLAEKGYDVLVVEAGRRFADADFATTSWQLRRYLWAPKLRCFGIQRFHLLNDVLILAGAGVGGGSLVYANTLYVPPKPFFTDRQWSDITDWAGELAPHYEQAERMLAVVEQNPCEGPVEEVMRAAARSLGVEHTVRKTPAGTFFGRDGGCEPGTTVPDPFFGGVGPARTGCTACGNCMVGCRRTGHRPVRHPDDGAFHRRLRDRLVAAAWGGGPLPPGLGIPGTVRRRRLDGVGESGGEPVADDHRAGRARVRGLAAARRARSPPRAGRALPAGLPPGLPPRGTTPVATPAGSRPAR